MGCRDRQLRLLREQLRFHRAAGFRPENAALSSRGACQTQVQNALDQCLTEGQIPSFACDCRYLPPQMMCGLNYDRSVYDIYFTYYAVDYGRLLQSFGGKQSVLSKYQSQLTPGEVSYFACELIEQNNWTWRTSSRG